ncbi:MAG: nucleoside triphosphate pyrophosphohydrolase [Firmicutes bacterium]|nr:nucleoside triphosphate pyrophosphohydrolase [Bacillota bacterium]
MAAKIVVVGLGPGGFDLLTVGTLERLKRAGRCFLRTAVHPAVEGFKEHGIAYTSFDSFYEEAPDFDTVYRRIADAVIGAAIKTGGGELVYAVPGHPTVAEESVRLILRAAGQRGIAVEVVGAVSFLDAVFAALHLDPVRGLQIMDGLDEDYRRKTVPNSAMGYVVTQVYNRLAASEVKLWLMQGFPDEHPVTVVRAAGVPGLERVAGIPLYELDHLDWLDHLSSVYVPPVEVPAEPTGAGSAAGELDELSGASGDGEERGGYPLDPLVTVMQRLRGGQGCPWDRQQTHQTLKPYLIEEGYEVLEAIDEKSMDKLCEELGDVLLQVVFHAQLAAEAAAFDMNDVVRTITEKMIRRHPHVFGETRVKGVSDVLRNWDEIKKGEHNHRERESILDGIPRDLPALLLAQKIQGRAAKVGFDWDNIDDAAQKVWEEAQELQEAYHRPEPGREDLENELGDLLFAVVNVARFLHVDAEVALRRTIAKFRRRFRFIEAEAEKQGLVLNRMTLAEMDALWEKAKSLE